MGSTQPGDRSAFSSHCCHGLPTWLLASHSYFISSCAKVSVTGGYGAMKLLVITLYITQKHLHWDTATVLHRIAMQIILHSGLRLKETRATAYLSELYVGRWMCGTCNFHGFCNTGWYVIWETIFSELHPHAKYQDLYMHADRKQVKYFVLVALGRQNLRCCCFVKLSFCSIAFWNEYISIITCSIVLSFKESFVFIFSDLPSSFFGAQNRKMYVKQWLAINLPVFGHQRGGSLGINPFPWFSSYEIDLWWVTSKSSAPMTKDFLDGFVKYVEISVFQIQCFSYFILCFVNASILNAECNANRTLLLLVNVGGEVRAVPLCHVMERLRV